MEVRLSVSFGCLRSLSTFDAVLSNLSLSWVNDLPRTFKAVHDALKPGGAFVATMYGRETLCELRSALQVRKDGT